MLTYTHAGKKEKTCVVTPFVGTGYIHQTQCVSVAKAGGNISSFDLLGFFFSHELTGSRLGGKFVIDKELSRNRRLSNYFLLAADREKAPSDLWPVKVRRHQTNPPLARLLVVVSWSQTILQAQHRQKGRSEASVPYERLASKD
ncbi:unnamed protein product [Ectocarpus sp. 12 AP-2014]